MRLEHAVARVVVYAPRFHLRDLNLAVHLLRQHQNRVQAGILVRPLCCDEHSLTATLIRADIRPTGRHVSDNCRAYLVFRQVRKRILPIAVFVFDHQLPVQHTVLPPDAGIVCLIVFARSFAVADLRFDRAKNLDARAVAFPDGVHIQLIENAVHTDYGGQIAARCVRLLLRSAVCKCACRKQQHRADHQRQRDRRHPRLFHNQPDARTKRAFAGRHRRRAERVLHDAAFAGNLFEKRPSVGNARTVVHVFERCRIASQLAVQFGQFRRQPDERVKPVCSHQKKPQCAPDLVASFVVRQLVQQHIAVRRTVFPERLRRQINCRTEQPKQACRAQNFRSVNRNRAAGNIQPDAVFPESCRKRQILRQKKCQRQRAPRAPEHVADLQNGRMRLRLRRILLRRLLRWLRLHCIRRVCLRTRCFVRCRRCCRRLFRRCLRPLHRSGRLLQCLHHRLLRHIVHHTCRAFPDRYRNEQPHRSQQPQPILQPRTDFSAQHQPHGRQRQNEN